MHSLFQLNDVGFRLNDGRVHVGTNLMAREQRCLTTGRSACSEVRMSSVRSEKSDLQNVLHSLVQDLGVPGPWGGGETQDLGQLSLPLQLLLHVAPHNLVVDVLLVRVMTLVDDQ